MIWGLDYKDTMDIWYNPLQYYWPNGQKRLKERTPGWEILFDAATMSESGRASWERIASCAHHIAQQAQQHYPRAVIISMH